MNPLPYRPFNPEFWTLRAVNVLAFETTRIQRATVRARLRIAADPNRDELHKKGAGRCAHRVRRYNLARTPIVKVLPKSCTFRIWLLKRPCSMISDFDRFSALKKTLT